MRNRYYNSIGVTQDLDATCHARSPGHNVSRKSKTFKRKTSKKVREVLKKDLQTRISESI